MLTNVRYILLTALRDWLFAALMLSVLACVMIAHMLGSTALIETQQMALSYATACARVVIVTGLIIFTCFHVRTAFDTREIDVFLSRPITRGNLVFSYWLGFAVLSVLLVLPTTGLIALQGLLTPAGFAFWAASLLLECWLMVAVSLLAAFTLKSTVACVMAGMGFYVLARLMGFFLAVAPSGLLKPATFIMPRLDLLAKSEWVVYGVADMHSLQPVLLQALAFTIVLILVTILDFRRRQF